MAQFRLEHGRLATAIDLWTKDGLWDTFTHMQIHKTQKKIDKAIMLVENIRRELKEEWDAEAKNVDRQ